MHSILLPIQNAFCAIIRTTNKGTNNASRLTGIKSLPYRQSPQSRPSPKQPTTAYTRHTHTIPWRLPRSIATPPLPFDYPIIHPRSKVQGCSWRERGGHAQSPIWYIPRGSMGRRPLGGYLRVCVSTGISTGSRTRCDRGRERAIKRRNAGSLETRLHAKEEFETLNGMVIFTHQEQYHQSHPIQRLPSQYPHPRTSDLGSFRPERAGRR
jgi:hypothetical protein